jgi:branched-chain amino acid transport system ATP-binding protein
LANRHVQELPYGQQRLVEIAKVIATGAQTLLLDEPAAGLHETEVEELAAVVLGIKETGRTVLIVEHNMPFVMGICDHLVVLDFGRVMASGDPVDVSRNPDVIASYFGKKDGHA